MKKSLRKLCVWMAVVTMIVFSCTGIMDVSATAEEAGSMTDLNQLISATSAGGTIKLEKDYAYTDGEDSALTDGLMIEKEITVDLTGTQLMAKEKSGFSMSTKVATLQSVILPVAERLPEDPWNTIIFLAAALST